MKVDDKSQDKYTVSQEKTEVNVAVIQNDVGYIKAKLEEMNKKFDVISVQFVTRAEFQTIKLIVYGMVGAILLAVLGTMLLKVGLNVGGIR